MEILTELLNAQTKGDVFFVLHGLINGKEGSLALLSGPPVPEGQEKSSGRLLADGWYWLRDGDADPAHRAPYKSKENAVKALEAWLRASQPGVRLLGHTFNIMTPTDCMTFAGAERNTLIAHLEDETVLLFDPNDNSISEVLPETTATEHAITDNGEVERRWTFEVVR